MDHYNQVLENQKKRVNSFSLLLYQHSLPFLVEVTSAIKHFKKFDIISKSNNFANDLKF